LRKSLLFASVLLLSASLAPAITGCGGDTGQAKTYMEQADASFEDATAAALELQKAQEGALGAIVGQDPAAFVTTGSLLPDIKQGIDDYEKVLKAARAEYEKMNTLKDVAPYKTYAKKMVEIIDVYLESVEVGKRIVSVVESVIAQIQSGQPVDMAAATRPMFDDIKIAFDLRNKAKGLEKEARLYQIDQNLRGQ
jgi:uncharacterized lipoprotein YehR (DUF1307 family)